MSTVMKASEFVNKLKDVATNYKTLYVMGCFGAPMTDANKERYCKNHSYNTSANRTKLIKAASADTFGFDCVCLIKGVLWGWNGNTNKVYGGAEYASNGVKDVSADGMINLCSNVTTDFSKIEVGEAVWCKGHIGVYIGDGLAVECTPAWKNRVQITAVKNIGTKSGYNARNWTKHGKLPYIKYDVTTTSATTSKPVTSTSSNTSVKIDYAQKMDKSLGGQYIITAESGLHIRTGAGTNKKSLGVLKKGTVVTNYGYYSVDNKGTKWLYVRTSNNASGFCSSKYLRKS